MDSDIDEKRTDVHCRVRLTLEIEAGEEMVIELEDTVDGSAEKADPLRLRNRIVERLEDRLVPRFRKQLWDWAEGQLPREEGTFDEEFARRCDRNHDVVDGLEWLMPHAPSDEERDWQERMVGIFMGRQVNETAR